MFSLYSFSLLLVRKCWHANPVCTTRKRFDACRTCLLDSLFYARAYKSRTRSFSFAHSRPTLRNDNMVMRDDNLKRPIPSIDVRMCIVGFFCSGVLPGLLACVCVCVCVCVAAFVCFCRKKVSNFASRLLSDLLLLSLVVFEFIFVYPIGLTIVCFAGCIWSFAGLLADWISDRRCCCLDWLLLSSLVVLSLFW